jgi:uncharacterized protein YndB with AHSA1/START domain
MTNQPRPPQALLDPLIKTVFVPLAPAEAFRLFTEGYGRWWPIASHSVGEEQAAACALECFPAGRIYETLTDGRQVEWGQVLEWQPPTRLVFSWRPGRAPDTAQQVEVVFTSHPHGSTLTLTHSGWELLGEQAAAVRPGYDTGWDYVLSCYTTLAASPS